MKVGIKNTQGFTLAELLVSLSIIAVITASMAMAVRGSQERARGYRTQAQLDKIERILQSEILKVVNQRSNVLLPPVGNSANSLGPHPQTVDPARDGANQNYISRGEGLFSRIRRFREESMRVLLLSRFPYETGHVLFDVNATIPVAGDGTLLVPFYQSDGAVSAARYGGAPPSWLQRYRAQTGVDIATGVPGLGGVSLPSDVVSSSELLVQVLSRIWIDGQPATVLFRDTEFGDTDGDGAKELLDAWGDPIGFRLLVRQVDNNGATFFCSLSDYSMWETNFTDIIGGVHQLADYSPDSMSLGKTKVSAYSTNMEDPLIGE